MLKTQLLIFLATNIPNITQARRMGTAHALKCALPKLINKFENVFVCYSDDTAFYPDAIISQLINQHMSTKSSISLLTVEKENPKGLGRVIRNKNDQIISIIEEKNATNIQKNIREINTGCYCFQVKFLQHYLPHVKKNIITNEYYLPDLVNIAISNNQKITALKIKNKEYFQGVNTYEELLRANKLMYRRLKTISN